MLTLCKSTVLGAAFLAGVAIAASADPLCCTPTGPYAAPYGGGIHAGGFGGFHGGGFHDGFAGLHHAVNPSLSLSAPTNSPLQEQMLRGLRYRPNGRTARAVATEPIGFWPAGAGDRPGTQRLHPEIAGNSKLDEAYLNDDYQGGEFYFTALDTVIKPKKGMLVAFTAGFYHEHAVLRVEGSQRLTMPFFLTFDRGRADPSLL